MVLRAFGRRRRVLASDDRLPAYDQATHGPYGRLGPAPLPHKALRLLKGVVQLRQQ